MVMFEMDGLPEKETIEAMHAASYKLPIKCKSLKNNFC